MYNSGCGGIGASRRTAQKCRLHCNCHSRSPWCGRPSPSTKQKDDSFRMALLALGHDQQRPRVAERHRTQWNAECEEGVAAAAAVAAIVMKRGMSL